MTATRSRLAALALAASLSGCATAGLPEAGEPAPSALAIGRVRLACLAPASVWRGPDEDQARSTAMVARRDCAGAVTSACYRGAAAGAAVLEDCIAAGVDRCEAEYREACGLTPWPSGSIGFGSADPALAPPPATIAVAARGPGPGQAAR